MKKLVYLFLCTAVLAGCSSSGVTPPGPTNPSGVAGTWSGTGTRGDDGQAFTIAMVVTGSGPSVSATATFEGALNAPNVSLTGTMTGNTLTLSGAGGNLQLSGTMAGSSLSGSGSALLQNGATLPFTFSLNQTAGDPTNPTPPTDPTNPPTDDGTCANTWNQNVTAPTTLTNTPSSCDYLLEGYVEITSTLTIEPGVVVRARQDANIVVDGGAIIAAGNAQNRIVLEGLNHVAGYWGGINVFEGRESRLEYLDLKDAGQNCTYLWCDKAGLILDDVTLSLANTTVSNSYVHGASVGSDVVFTSFADNRFYGNTWAGLVIAPETVGYLDAGSDYLGADAPNGTPFVGVGGNLDSGNERVWRKLNAPYLVDGYLDIEGGTLTLEPGVEMVFGDDGWLTVKGNGELRAVGTAAQPITFKGRQAQLGYWDGITFWDSDWEGNQLSYVQISHSGSTEKSIYAYAAVRLRNQSRVNINNSVISDNAHFGVACDEQSEYVGSPTLVLGPGNTFSNNASGDIDPECEAAMTP